MVVSLLPYLQPGISPFCLRLRRARAGDESEADRSPEDFPFASWWDADPYTNLLQADLVAGQDGRVVSFYLFLQRDRYHAAEDSPIRGNVDIEKIWHRSLVSFKEMPGALGSRWAGGDPAGSGQPVTFGAWDSTAGHLVPFAPLLYCRKTDRFFHLFCPRCGHVLHLCRDDGILERNGLEPYFTTLERHLYCAVCHESRFGSPFYRWVDEPTAAQPAGDPAAGASVKTQNELIDQYMRLPVSEMKAQEDFPCPACAWNLECYGAVPLWRRRVAFFSFYPFLAVGFQVLPGPERLPLVVPPPMKQGPSRLAGAERVPDGSDTDSSIGDDRNRAIRSILQRIRVRWAARQEAGDSTAVPGHEEVTGETVLLVDRVEEPGEAGVEIDVAPADLEETIILGPGAVADDGRGREARAAASSTERPGADPGLDATVVLGSHPLPGEAVPGGPARGEPELDRTVLLDEPEAAEDTRKATGTRDPDELAETVMVSRKPKQE